MFFVGINSITLKNTNIGDNVIIGIDSVLSGNVDPNVVYVRSPEKNNVLR